MKRILIACVVIILFALNVSGCVKRVNISTIEKERIDQDTNSGNMGYIKGPKPPSEPSQTKLKTRKIYQVTLEVPPYAEWKNFRPERTEDEELWGNRGYIYGGPQPVVRQPDPLVKSEPIILPEDVYEEADAIPQPETVKPEPVVKEKVKFISYKVQKGDTLQKISKKVYGTTKKWQQIFDFNKGILKSPNKIYPGQKILIPQD